MHDKTDSKARRINKLNGMATLSKTDYFVVFTVSGNSIFDAVPKLNNGAKRRYHLLKELEQLKHSCTASWCLSQYKI